MAGDTLRSIAQRVYGNDSLWYVLASANALTGGETLAAGTTLKVPEVQVNKNDATTFKPYNPAEVIGSTSPSLDYVPPPPKKSCNVLSVILTIIVVVIVAVVTVYTAGAAAPLLGASVAGVSGTMATGAAVLGGAAGFTWGAVAAVAVAGAVGSAVGQLASMAFGLTDKFDWGAVAVGALSSVATMGVGSALSGGASTATTGATAAKDVASGTQQAAANVFNFGSNWAKGAAQAVAGNLANYGSNWLVNRIDPSRDRSNEKFSWANLAASAVSGAITAELGAWLGSKSGSAAWFARTPVLKNSFAQTVLNGTVTGFVGSATQHHVARLLGEEGDADYGQMLVDAFGNGLAEATKKSLTDLEAARIARKEREKALLAMSEELSKQGIDLRRDERGRLYAEVYVQAGEEGTVRKIDSYAVVDMLGGMSDRADQLVATGELSPQEKRQKILEVVNDPLMQQAMASAAEAEYAAKTQRPLRKPSVAASQPATTTESPKEVIVDGGTLKEVVVIGYLDGGFSDVIDMVTSGVEAVANFADRHPILAKIGVAGIQAVITGGPIKSILRNFAKNIIGEVIDSVTDAVQQRIETATSSFLRDRGWSEASSTLAGQLLGFGFVLLAGGAQDVIDAAKNLRGSLKKLRASGDDIRQDGVGLIASANRKFRKVISNGYTYELDDLGRPTSVTGNLRLNRAQGRNAKAQLGAGGSDRLSTDEGGHFIGRRFDGPTDDFNHFAQDMNLNRSAYKTMENEWQTALSQGKKVNVSITPTYPGQSLRPSELTINYTIDGQPYQKRFKNQRGG